MNSYFRKKALFYCSVIIFFPILFRFFELQILEYNRYKKLAGNNSLRSIEIKAPRGIIYDRNLIPLVDNIYNYNFEIMPIDIVDRKTYSLDSLDNADTLINDKNVLVTGAGGSIGSVLSRQIISYNPKSLLLLDHSESALFAIEQKLKQMNSDIKIITKLIDLSDKNLLDDLFNSHDINMVYHAAAYKHVNMLESNILSGVKNNIIGLYYLLHACEKNNVSNFVLISTDKAVKPTTIMGMTKKFCELMMFNFQNSKNCIYSAVRFGNVFNSSGSVVPIFKKQMVL